MAVLAIGMKVETLSRFFSGLFPASAFVKPDWIYWFEKTLVGCGQRPQKLSKSSVFKTSGMAIFNTNTMMVMVIGIEIFGLLASK